MKRFLNLLLFITIFKFVSNNNVGRTRIIDASDTNNSNESIYTSFNTSINSNSNNTITHKTEFDTELNHLVVDKNTGRVFIGGRNRIYQLSPDLDIVATAITGPKNDSKDCSVNECTQNLTRKPTDNINKVLLIDYTTSRLITCGSLFQGICSVRSLQNVSLPETDVVEAIVANIENASTVAFIAPGPPQPPVTNVMYVGVTYAGNSLYRSEIPAVASRSLEKNRMFSLASSAVTTGTRMFINPSARESYPVNYVYGFSSERFSYFLTTQLKHSTPSAAKEYITKLARICHEDSHYYSYTEIPIDCIGEGIKYNLVQAAYLGKPGSDLADNLGGGITPQDDVLYAVFSEGKDNVPGNRSALCVYSLKSIRRKFMQNIKSCFNGHGQRGLDFILPNMPCVSTKLQTIGEDFCGLDVNYPLGGEQAIAAVPVATFDKQLTAVAATRTSGFTVVFVGTIDGHIKKIVLDSGSSATPYADIRIHENSPVNPDMQFDLQELNLYVMTKNRVSKVKVYDCSVYSNCAECLGARDPYCGWCSLENKCSLRSKCDDNSNDPLFWVTYKTGKCTTITSVVPHQLQRTTARTLELAVDQLPLLKEQLLCAFTTADKPTLFTNATRKRNGVNCTTPRTDALPQIAPGKHHFTAKLSVRTQNGPDLVSTSFTFFDCSTHLSCTQCVSSQFPCDWCVEAHRCTHDTAENCRNDILVTGVSRIGPSYRSGPSFCPTINATGDGSEILVASGSKKTIKVKVHIIGQFIVQTRFVCQFNIEGRVTSVNAQLLGDTIYCDQMEFIYTSKAPNLTATFAVIWGGSKPLDNPDNIHVVIYRCRDMCDSCGTCLALPEKYGCGWCQSTGTCEVNEQCAVKDDKKNDWLNRSHTCPNPKIFSFSPATGPLEGGTNITIRGINLGKSFSDIYSGVTVASMSCMPFQNLYVDTKEIVCKVDGPGDFRNREGRIVVEIGDYRGESMTNFQFVDPSIMNFDPKFGPVSGGTQVTIQGNYLNAGSLIKAYIGDLACEVLSIDESQALCRTSPSDEKRSGKLRMEFDGANRDFNGDQFQYEDDPTIVYATSGPGGQKTPKGIPAGGIKIFVHGTNLRIIQNPKIYVHYDGKTSFSHCAALTNTEMECDSPIIDADSDRLNADDPIKLEFGFLMDDVASVQNLSSKGQQKFELYPNPWYAPFEEDIKYFKSEYLTINGRNLDRASKETDVIVMIGDGVCNITSLSRHQLTCRPPTDVSDSNENPKVVVRVGQALAFDIGMLSYASPTLMPGLSRNAMLGGMASIIILIGFFISLVIAYRKKTSESNRVLKNMQEQMDILELQVAAECKEAFAELQTEMGDMTGDLTSGGIPFLDYRTYAMKILFPNNEEHVVLQWERPELLKKEKGLRLFGQLIMNKTFLLLFIRTLESNRYFSMRERVNVASLIMVTLQSKLEYCTDILKTLLAELIEKCIDGKSHPKLLLRRTESVAEKMLSAWFTFLLHKFLRECAGEPLYMLFRAVKGQMDKGPVDAITHEARYSLSEEKLIRQLIDFKCMSIYASITQQPILCTNNIEMLPTNTENVPVRVLDCDTIGQVKEKCLESIYRNTPWGQRPRRDDLDLEWRTGSSGRVILYDEDSTSKMDSEWKKLNTLHHYRVPDGACLSLVSRQSPIYNLSMLSDKNDKSHKYETLNLSKYPSSSPPFSRAGSPLNADVQENGLRYWHLVKHHDIDLQKEGERVNKMVSEIYLTRLLATKGTLQKFVDDLFETIFSTDHRGSALPLAIKYMFDFLDDQALLHGITDPEVVHTWKSNSLPLRFWVNLIKNPNFVFDIHKSNIVDSCLSVVAQTFMDSCSTSDHRLGKDSPSSKLLYAKDIPSYRQWVERYYSDIREMPAISDQDMNAMLAEESRLHTTEFNTNCALHELYTYAVKYNEQLTVTLEEDEFSQKQRLAYKLEQVHNIMSSE